MTLKYEVSRRILVNHIASRNRAGDLQMKYVMLYSGEALFALLNDPAKRDIRDE